MVSLSTRAIRSGRLVSLTLLAFLSGGCEMAGGTLSLRPSADDEDVWAIRCLTLRGSNRFQLARSYTDALKKVAPQTRPGPDLA